MLTRPRLRQEIGPGTNISLYPSELTAKIVYLPNDDGDLVPFSFKGREYLIPVYDTVARRVLLKFARQSEKTVREDACVITAHGERVSIKDVQVGDRLATMLVDGAHTGARPVVWKSGRYRKRCVRVTTQLGHTIDLGYTHPVRQWDRWTIADDLKPGDRVATVRKLQEESVGVETMDARHVAFVGYMLGYGSLSSTLGFTQDADSPALAHFREICAGFGWRTREHTRKGSNSVDVRFNRTDAEAFGLLTRLGMIGCTSATKFVPECLMRLPTALTVELLQAMWACAGHVKKHGNSGYEIVYCSISKKMALQVQALLWKIGVPSRIRAQTPKAYVGTDKRAYLVHVRTRTGIERFLTTLTIPGKRADAPGVEPNDNRDTLPMEAATQVHGLYAALPCKHGSTAHAAGIARMKLEYAPSQRKFGEMVTYLSSRGADVSQLAPHLTSDLYWDVVVSVEDLGEQWCYDLEVEETSNFLVEGVVTHNSTYLGNSLLMYSILRRHFRSLLVTPTQTQTETFSRDKLAKIMFDSKKIQMFSPGVQSVFRKTFTTGSEIDLRYAFLHADRTRGIPKVDLLAIDEIQDILAEVIPIVEETQKHSTFRMKRYSGTPKSVDNTIAVYWQRYSTQYEWAMPCDHHTPRHWVVAMSVANIGKKHLICERCGNQVFPAHPDARWASMRPKSWLDNPPVALPFEGYRIPQIITPWVDWDEILDTMGRYTVAQFHNEVLGMEYDSGEKLLTKETLEACSGGYDLEQGALLAQRAQLLWMGIDWGSDGESKTVVTIGGYFGGKFAYVYMKRFVGEESTFVNMMPIIKGLIETYNPRHVGVDYGGGLDRNDDLIRAFGISRIVRYQYAGNKKLYFDNSLMRWMVNRTEALMAFINAINRKNEFEFPKWECWEHPFAQDLLSVFKEYNNSRRTIEVNRTPGTTDDTLHSMLYCFLASMVVHPRHDILAPDKER